MEWKIFLSTFLTIFLAEMGDKTQFAALAAGAKSDSTLSVLFGVVLGLSLAGALGVLFGKALGEFMNPVYLKYISGGLFVIVGAWILIGK